MTHCVFVVRLINAENSFPRINISRCGFQHDLAYLCSVIERSYHNGIVKNQQKACDLPPNECQANSLNIPVHLNRINFNQIFLNKILMKRHDPFARYCCPASQLKTMLCAVFLKAYKNSRKKIWITEYDLHWINLQHGLSIAITLAQRTITCFVSNRFYCNRFE